MLPILFHVAAFNPPNSCGAFHLLELMQDISRHVTCGFFHTVQFLSAASVSAGSIGLRLVDMHILLAHLNGA